jgi:hypothetical protein
MIKLRRVRWAGHISTNEREQELLWDIGGKARRKETTWKTKT